MTYKRANTRRTPKHDAMYFWLTRNIKSVCQAMYLSSGYDKLDGFVTSVAWQWEKPLTLTKYSKPVYPDCLKESYRVEHPDGHCWKPEFSFSSCYFQDNPRRARFSWKCSNCHHQTGYIAFRDSIPRDHDTWMTEGTAQLKGLYESWKKDVQAKHPPPPTGLCGWQRCVNEVLEIKPEIESFEETLRQMRLYEQILGESWSGTIFTMDARFDGEWVRNGLKVVHPLRQGLVILDYGETEDGEMAPASYAFSMVIGQTPTLLTAGSEREKCALAEVEIISAKMQVLNRSTQLRLEI